MSFCYEHHCYSDEGLDMLHGGVERISELKTALNTLLDALERADSRALRGCSLCGGIATHMDGCAILSARKVLE
jgi:hypothetical protein